MGGTPQPLTPTGPGAWNPIAEAKTKYPGLASESEDKIGEFLSQPQNFRSSFPEYAHLDDQTIVRNMANVRAIAPLKTDVPANTMPQVSHLGEVLPGGGGEANRGERQALVKEAGSPLGVPLVAGARALESSAGADEQARLATAAKTGDTGSGIPPTLKRMGADTLRMGAGLLTPSSQAISAIAPLAPTLTGAGLATHGLVNAAKNAPEAIKGNPEAVKNVLSSGSEAAGGAALAGSGIAEGARDVKAIAKPLRAAVESNLGLKTLGIVKPEPVKALTQAIQPGVNIPRAQESMPIAGSRLQQVKNAGLVTDREGNPLTEYKSNGDILQGVKAAKAYVWNALEQRTGSVAKLSTDTNAVADAMEKSISKRTAEQYPEIAKKVQARADTYRGMKTFRDIENAIQDANDDLRGYYKRSTPTDSPITAETAATEAEVKVLRKMLDEKVEALTGSGTSELKREYGALRDVERAAAKQYAVETRQKGANLWEGLAALRAAGDFVSGNVLGAAKGVATMAVGRRLGLVRTPAWLIDQAFQGPKAFDAAPEIAPPPGVKIAGALPAAGESQASHVRPEPGIGARGGIQTVPPSTEGQARDIPRNNEGVNVMPSSGKPIVTPRPGVEVAPGAPQLPAGPAGPGRLNAGPEAKQLPPARSIQVGPSSLPPEPEKPPTLTKQTEKPAPPTISKKTAPAKTALDPVKELAETKFQMRDLEKRINGTQNAYKMKPLIERFRKLEARAKELAPAEGGKSNTEETPTKPTGAAGTTKETAPAIKREEAKKPTPRTVSLSTYNSLPKEVKAAVDAQMEELSHMPQALREGRMRQLAGFGGPGTFLKERLAREAVEDMKKIPHNEE